MTNKIETGASLRGFRLSGIPVPLALALIVVAIAVGVGIAAGSAETLGVLCLGLALLLVSVSRTSALLCFLAFVILQDPVQILVGGETTPLGLLLKRADEPMLVALVGICLFFDRRIHGLLGQRWFTLPVLGLYGAMILSTALYATNWLAAGLDIVLLSKPFLFLLLGVGLASVNLTSQRGIWWILTFATLILISGLLFMIFPALQDYYLSDIRTPDERLGLASAQGLFLGPGAYSWFAAATFSLAYAAYLVFRRRTYLLISLFAVGAVVLSWRRKSISAVVMILLISLLISKAKGTRSRVVVVVGIACLATASFLAPYFEGLWQITQREYVSADPLYSARSALHYTGLLIALDHFPLGSGLGTFGSFASRLFYSDTYFQYGLARIYGLSPTDSNYITDTYWPMILGEGGVLALAFMGYLFWQLIKRCWVETQVETAPPEHYVLALVSLFLIAGSLAESTASHIYGSSFHAAIALVPAGILIGRKSLASA